MTELTLEQLEQVRDRVNQKLKDLSVPVTLNIPFLLMLEILSKELANARSRSADSADDL